MKENEEVDFSTSNTAGHRVQSDAVGITRLTGLASSVGSALRSWLQVQSPADDASNVGEVTIAYMHCLPRKSLSRWCRVSRYWRTLKKPRVGKIIHSHTLRRRS